MNLPHVTAPATPRRPADAGSQRWSLWSRDSLLSIGSRGSVLSIGSVGSVLSVGSIGSAGSVLSVGSAGCVGSALSAASHWSLLSSRSHRAILRTGHVGAAHATSVLAGVAVAAALIDLLRRSWTGMQRGRADAAFPQAR